MKKIFFIVIIMFSVVSFSQEKENYNKVSEQFMLHFNAENYDAIFGLFDEGMKAALPKEQAISFLKDISTNLGEMKSIVFSNTMQEAHIYKTTFDNGLRDILIYLNTENEIGGLFVKPHKPDNLPKLERNTTKMILPFNDEWFVFWGGINQVDNYHVAYENQNGAFDFIIVKDGKHYEANGTLKRKLFCVW